MYHKYLVVIKQVLKLTGSRSLRGKVGAVNLAPVLPVLQGFSFDKFQSGPMCRTSIILCYLFLENIHVF